MLRFPLLPALLCGLAAVPTAWAEDPKTPTEKLEARQKQLEDNLTKAVNDIASLKEKVKALESQANTAGIDDLRREVEKLRQELRTAQNSSSSKKTTAPDAATGKLRLVNRLPMSLTVDVNGALYTVDASSTRDVTVPAGRFTYQVGGEELRASTVPAGYIVQTVIESWRP